jgi:type I restriction enzyme S subunit
MSELSLGWCHATFDDVIENITNGVNGKQNKDGIGLPVSRIETIANQSIDMQRIGFVSDYDEDNFEKYRLNEGDILFSHINSPSHLGKTALCGKNIKLFHGVNLLRIVVNGAVTPEFFNFYCKYIRGVGEFSLKAQHAVNQSSLNQQKLKQFILPIAPLSEQIRIANKLDSLLAKVDTAQARLEKIPTLLKRFRQSVLAAATSGELTREWRNNLDPDWLSVSLKDVATGFNYGSSAKSQSEGDVPVLRMGNLQGGKLDWTDLVYSSDKTEIEKYLLEAGDVLFNRTNSPELVGKTSIYRGERQSIFAGYLIRIKGSERLNSEYLNILLNSPHARDYCWQVKTDGVSQSNINAKKIQAYEFELPTIQEQTEIVRRVESLFALADTVEKQYLAAKQRLDRLSQSLLAKAFRGELVPQDPNDEPAAELLKRIQAERQAQPAAKQKRSKPA